MKLLPDDAVTEIYEAAIRAGLVRSRSVLLSGVDARFVASLSSASTPSAQLYADLQELNQIPELSDGTVPLQAWLKNALLLAGPRTESSVFQRALEKLPGRRAGASDETTVDLAEEVEPGTENRGLAHLMPPPTRSGWSGSGARALLAYAPEDERFARDLVKHLSSLTHGGMLSLWDWRSMPAGTDVRREMAARFEAADLVLLLVSADLLASSELYAAVVTPALARAKAGARVIPILARPSDFWGSELGHLMPLPSTGEPITQFRTADEAFVDIARSLREMLKGRAPEAKAAFLGGERGLHDYRGPTPAAAVSPPPALMPIEKIFRVSGATPDATYVEPQEHRELVGAMQVMQYGLIVEGPSGIGKTTAVRKALPAGAQVKWLHVLKQAAIREIDQLTESGEVSGHVVIDDFHKLDDKRKRAVADLMKLVSDDDGDAKITLIGVSNARNPIFVDNPNLAGRVQSIRFKRQPNSKIEELVTKGERAANVCFLNRADLVLAAQGSFLVAQQLCSDAVREMGIRETQRERVDVDVPVNDSVARVMASFKNAYDGRLLDFATSDRDDPVRGVCFSLLWVLSRNGDGCIRPVEVGYQVEELQKTIEGMSLGEITRRCNVTKIAEYLHVERDSVSIENPQFGFYLQQLHRGNGWQELAERAGLTVTFESSGQLRISVPRAPAEAAAGQADATRFLDRKPFPWWDPNAVKLCNLLADLYEDADQAKRIAAAAGVDTTRWDSRGGPGDFWHALIDTASKQKGRLVALLDVVLKDRGVSNYHADIRALIEG
jgi:Effector-associated domain 5/Effector-associated domain 1/TIR domain